MAKNRRFKSPRKHPAQRTPANPKVKSFIINTLPDMAKEIDDRVVRGIEREMQRDWHPEYEQAFGVKRPERPPATREVEPVEMRARGYMVRATHSRLTGAGEHEFTGEVPMARVTLPMHQAHNMGEFPFGDVFDGDHKLYTLELVREYYAEYLDFTPARVDLITPVRYRGERFAAVAIYLLYNEDMELTSYIFESGMATGKPMVLYAAKSLDDVIVRRSGYVPTPFASIDNWYRGTISMDGDDPTGFEIEIREEKDTNTPPFFRLSATMEPSNKLPILSPLVLRLQAALRVCAIADARGEQVPGLGVLTGLLAPLGRALPWVKVPGAKED